jgi:uncharacterized membrane protein
MPHHEVTRLEGFSDAVFGFALTLLVVSLEIPQDMAKLVESVRGFIPFALMFAMICWIWYQHNVFFRRYSMQDPWTVFLNCFLLFVVLFYVYPLKFLTTTLTKAFAGDPIPMQAMDGQTIMLLYSGGVILIFATFLLLHRHAWKHREALRLDAADELALKYSARAHGISMSIGVVSILLALANPRWSWLAGVIYGSMGPLHAWNGYRSANAHAKLARVQGHPAQAAETPSA